MLTVFIWDNRRKRELAAACRKAAQALRRERPLSCTGVGADQHGSSFLPRTAQQTRLKSEKACIAVKEKGFALRALLKPEVQGTPGESQAALTGRKVSTSERSPLLLRETHLGFERELRAQVLGGKVLPNQSPTTAAACSRSDLSIFYGGAILLTDPCSHTEPLLRRCEHM